MEKNGEDLIAMVEGCRRMDRGSQRLLYLRYYGWAMRTVYRYVGSYEQTKEVVHETFVRLFRSFGQFLHTDDEGIEVTLLRWMRDLFVHSAVWWVQSQSSAADELERDNISQPDVWANSDPSCNPAEAALHRQLMIRLVTLPAKLRLAFNLRVIDGYSPAQAAGLSGIRQRRLERYLLQARFLLRLPLGEEHDESGQ